MPSYKTEMFLFNRIVIKKEREGHRRIRFIFKDLDKVEDIEADDRSYVHDFSDVLEKDLAELMEHIIFSFSRMLEVSREELQAGLIKYRPVFVVETMGEKKALKHVYRYGPDNIGITGIHVRDIVRL